MSCLVQDADGECPVCATGGETEQEKIRVDIVENQVIDNRMQFIRLCYNPDFVSCLWWSGQGWQQDLKACIQICSLLLQWMNCY